MTCATPILCHDARVPRQPPASRGNGRDPTHANAPLRVGVIADTHGLLRPEALGFLAGCDHLIHAGDIGAPEILAQLASVAPLIAVRGNNDEAEWAAELPTRACVEVGGVSLVVIHERPLCASPAPKGSLQVVISGHSHRPGIELVGACLYLNPGSAGPRRFKLPISVGELLITDASVEARTFELPVTPIAAGRNRR